MQVFDSGKTQPQSESERKNNNIKTKIKTKQQQQQQQKREKKPFIPLSLSRARFNTVKNKHLHFITNAKREGEKKKTHNFVRSQLEKSHGPLLHVGGFFHSFIHSFISQL